MSGCSTSSGRVTIRRSMTGRVLTSARSIDRRSSTTPTSNARRRKHPATRSRPRGASPVRSPRVSRRRDRSGAPKNTTSAISRSAAARAATSENRRRARGGYSSVMTPWVLRLFIANVAMYFAQLALPGLEHILGLQPARLLVQPWTPITYMFLHDRNGFTHLLFNMLGLYFFGPRLEERLGSRHFLGLYFTSGLTGA